MVKVVFVAFLCVFGSLERAYACVTFSRSSSSSNNRLQSFHEILYQSNIENLFNLLIHFLTNLLYSKIPICILFPQRLSRPSSQSHASLTMARRYDSSTTTFSPEGRLHQVEYAIEAINNAGTCIGILAKDGIVMASERRISSGLLAPAKVGIVMNVCVVCCMTVFSIECSFSFALHIDFRKDIQAV